MLKFHIADSAQTSALSITLADMMKIHPEMFRENISVGSFFGSPPVAWNGGRMVLGSFYPDKVKKFLDSLNSRGIPYRFTFTNPSLTEKDLEDPASNDLLEIADNGINEVIVNSPLLEAYIRQTHPRMKLTSSTCKCIRDMDAVKEELAKGYSLVVLDYNFNNNFEELEKLTREERSRCELLVNTCCLPGCTRRGEHYRYIGDIQRRLPEFWKMSREEYEQQNIAEWECPYREYRPHTSKPTVLRITADDLYGKYAEMGFENFKIEGRMANMMILAEQLAEYMARPECYDMAVCELMTVTLERFGG